jgi:hypothetical protein
MNAQISALRKGSAIQTFKIMENRRAILALSGLAGLIIFLCLLGVAGLILFRPQISVLVQKPTPTPACVQPTLTLGAAKFRIESLKRGNDGSFTVPPNTPGVAYWIEGTSPQYVLTLSPTAENMTVGTSIKVGDTALLVWADCGEELYAVQKVEIGTPDIPALLSQPGTGFTLFIQSPVSPVGLVIQGERPEILATQIPGPMEETGGIQAEINFLETTTSSDGKTVAISISILNKGNEAFSLTDQDISLTPENGPSQAPLHVEPALPRQIPPGAIETFQLTFPRPDTNFAVLKILDFSIDYYF